jgi:outer membrane scaffolding protein for murein synthesis (MipA/OmpV family)
MLHRRKEIGWAVNAPHIIPQRRAVTRSAGPQFSIVPALILAAFCHVTPGFADGEDDDVMMFSDVSEEMDNAPGFDTEPAKENWKFSLGAVVGIKPDYEGSNDYEFAWAPDIKISWRDTIVLRGKSLRVVYRWNKLRAGALIATEGGRDEDDNNALRGLGDVDSGFAAGAFLDYKILKRVTLKSEYRHEFADGHGGALFDLGAELKLPFGKPWVKAYFGATYASEDYTEAFFGVNANQSAGSGLPQYNADGGVKNFTFSLASGYDITENWVIGATVIYSRLVGDAADSPIVEQRGSKDQVTAGIGLSYQF